MGADPFSLAIMGAVALASAVNQAQARKDQKKATTAQQNAQREANELQERAASQAEQQNNRANKQTVDANAILGAISEGYSGNLTGSRGVDRSQLTLGTPSTLGTKTAMGTTNTLGSKSTLGNKNNGTLF